MGSTTSNLETPNTGYETVDPVRKFEAKKKSVHNLCIKQRGELLTPKQAEEMKQNVFLKKHPEFKAAIENEITSLRNAPTEEPKKGIYENSVEMLVATFEYSASFGLANENSEEEKLGFIKKMKDSWIKALHEIAGKDGSLEYSDLLPKTTYAPEVNVLLKNFVFLREVGKLAEAKNKGEFISEYLKKWAGEMMGGEVSKEAAARFVNEAYAVLLRSVGEKHITKEDFEKLWEEDVLKDPAIEKIWKTAQETEASGKFEELFGKEVKEIIALRKEEITKDNLRLAETEANPSGSFFRRYGDLFSVLLYGGEKVLYGIIIANFALAGFNPITLLQNPVMLATTAGVAGIVNYFKPIFPETPATEVAAEKDFSETLRSLDEKSPVRKWLEVTDINDAVKELLARKDEAGAITSAELIKCFPGKEEDFAYLPKIKAGDQDGNPEQLFQLLLSCKNKGLNPKEIFDV